MKLRAGLLVLVSVVALLAVPPAVAAQQTQRVYRVGLFHVGLDHVPPSLENLKKTLRGLGYEEGKNLHLDWRNLPDEPAAHKTAADFVRDGVDLIVAFENHTVRAAKAATSSIPIVMVHVTDPVEDGFVRSLAHPGGNVTGFAGLPDYPAKQLEIFTEIFPGLRRVLLLIDPRDPVTPRQLAEVRRAATTLRLERVERQATDEADVRRVSPRFNLETSTEFSLSRQIFICALRPSS
jgi:putative tryptophan/tyrosine transport system substrate-binding protein